MASAAAVGSRAIRSSDRIDVLQGIEADASKSPCRFIAKKMGDEAMRRFMKGDGDSYWDHPNGRQVEHIRQAAVLRARLPHLLRSEGTRFKKRKICATILANVRFSDQQRVMLLSYLVPEAIARREKPIVNQPVERA